MRQLTQEEAERCARACDWERKTGSHKYEWAPAHGAIATKWWEKDGEWQGVDPHPNFLDPYFWFGRLWDTLDEKAYGGFTVMQNDNGCRIAVNSEKIVVNIGHLCLAFCEAIEKLCCSKDEQHKEG